MLIVTQLSNYVFVPIFSHAGLTLSVGLGACVNALFLFLGLRKRGIYMPSSGWTEFFVQLLGACLVLAARCIGSRSASTGSACIAGRSTGSCCWAACLVLFAALYFGIFWLMGFKYAYFKRRVK